MGFKLPKIKMPKNNLGQSIAGGNPLKVFGDAVGSIPGWLGDRVTPPSTPKPNTAPINDTSQKLQSSTAADTAKLQGAADAARAMAEQRAANPTKTGTVTTGQTAVATAAPAQQVNTDLSNIYTTVGDDVAQIGELERMEAAQVGPVQQAGNQNVGDLERVQAAEIADIERANAANISLDPQEQLRQQQLSLAQRLEAQSMGEGPSVAQSQMQTATDRAIKQQMAMAAASGMDPAMAQRMAMENTANLSQEAGRASAELRMAEQLNAQNALANVAGTARQQDVGLATDQAKMQQEAALNNAAAQNTQNLEQAKLQQQAGIENAAAQNNKLVAEAKMRQEVELTNRANNLAAQLKQAELEQDANKINKIQQDMAQIEQSKMDLQKAQFNAEAYNRAQEWSKKLSSQEQQANAQLKAQVDMFNSGQINASTQADAARKLQADIANQEAILKAKGMDDAAIAASMGMSLDAMKTITSANLSANAADLNAQVEIMKAQLGAATGAAASQSGMLGSLAGAAGAVGAAWMMSDKRAKKNIKDGDRSIEDFLNALNSYEFKYKDGKAPGAAEGQRFGIMIQDIENTPVGASLVIDDGGMKKMDVAQSVGAALAGLGHLNKKIEKLTDARSFAQALESNKPSKDTKAKVKTEEKDIGFSDVLKAMKNKKSKTGRYN